MHLHGGDEYSHQPNAAQTALVERLTRSPDVDLVLGDHAHVVQPITRVHGTWVVYGMGNMVAQQDPARADTYQGILARFTFTERRSGRFAVTRAAYAPIGWNVWHPGSAPIRVVRLHGAAADVGDVVRRGAGRAAGAAPALSVSRRCRRCRPAGSPRPRRPGPRRHCPADMNTVRTPALRGVLGQRPGEVAGDPVPAVGRQHRDARRSR